MAAPRLFFALWPDEPTRAALLPVQRAMRAETGGRALHPEDLHITLAFLGPVSEARLPCVLAAGDQVRGAPHTLTLARRGSWPGPRVGWVAPIDTPAALTELVSALWRGLVICGFTPEARAYRPHITVLRKAGRVPDADLAEPIPWRVDGFVLAESVSGPPGTPRYRVRHRWPLPAAEE